MPGESKKPKWGKPKLIILVRGKPEETVLAGCKGGYGGAAGHPNGMFGACVPRIGGMMSGCVTCHTISGPS